MPGVLASVLDCCCETIESPETVVVPGPSGADGADGSDGVAGQNAFTLTTESFEMPAVDAGVEIAVEDGEFLSLGQNVYIANAGYFVVTAEGTTTITVENLGASGNATEGDVIPASSKVSPAGPPGPEDTDGLGLDDLPIITLSDRTALKAYPSRASLDIVILTDPESGVSKIYRSVFGDTTTADDVSVIEPTDGLARYFEHSIV